MVLISRTEVVWNDTLERVIVPYVYGNKIRRSPE